MGNGTESSLCKRKRVLKQCVVKRTKDKRPGQYRHALRFHVDGMSQDCAVCVLWQKLESVDTVETGRAGKAKRHPLAGAERFNRIAHRAVTSGSANTQLAIKAHARPHASWPKSIAPGRERVQQGSCLSSRGWNFTFVNIKNLHAATI